MGYGSRGEPRGQGEGMTWQFNRMHRKQWVLAFSAALLLSWAPSDARAAQQAASPAQSSASSEGRGTSSDSAKPETHITPEQAKELFSLVDELLKFSSQETGLPIKS